MDSGLVYVCATFLSFTPSGKTYSSCSDHPPKNSEGVTPPLAMMLALGKCLANLLVESKLFLNFGLYRLIKNY